MKQDVRERADVLAELIPELAARIGRRHADAIRTWIGNNYETVDDLETALREINRVEHEIVRDMEIDFVD